MTTTVTDAALRDLEDLHEPVRNWTVEEGPDLSGEQALWVWATLADKDLDPSTRARIRQRVKRAVRRSRTPAPWVYVRFRSASESLEP